MASLKVIITGSTGMVGEGVLLHCLESKSIEKVLSVSRRSIGRTHPKLTELLVPDFMKLDGADSKEPKDSPQSKMVGYDACFYCATGTSIGVNEADYTKVTYDQPVHFATTVAKLNPGMVMVYVSGRGADSTEKGKVMWARVKGRAENELMRLPFKAVYNFRPGLMKPVEGQRSVGWATRTVLRAYPLWKRLFPGMSMTLDEVGEAMIRSVIHGAPKQVLEVTDMQALVKS